MTTKKNIRSLNRTQLQEFFGQHGAKTFRANQVYEWLWKKSVQSFEEMSNLPKTERSLLEEHFMIPAVKVDQQQISSDRTIKNAFRLYDGNMVEGVLIPTPTRMTACVSSQAGCSLTCKFCATGKLPRMRNLEADEIYDQVAIIGKQAMEHYNIPLSNIVYMGMGEPLLNYRSVLDSVERISSPEGMNMSPRRITVSTAGIAKMIKKLGDDEVKFRLALSLHAADDKKRNEIMPINEQNTLESLTEALIYFYNKTGSRVTLEYILFNEFNDSPEDARALIAFSKKFPTRINIIEYNPIGDGLFTAATDARRDAFSQQLENAGLRVSVRRSRGQDINAACGQLANTGRG